MPSDELLVYILNGKYNPLRPQLRDWLHQSPRFYAFVNTYRDKIRKKLRLQQDEAALLDLKAELYTAYLLVQIPGYLVSYEPYASAKTRGPDFSVRVGGGAVFNVEATRMRDILPDFSGDGFPDGDKSLLMEQAARLAAERVAEVVLNKLSQMRSEMGNLLVIHAEKELVKCVSLGPAMVQLQIRAERKDPELFFHGDMRSPADFFKYYQRLNGILLRSLPEKDADLLITQFWKNPRARQTLPAAIHPLIKTLHSPEIAPGNFSSVS